MSGSPLVAKRVITQRTEAATTRSSNCSRAQQRERRLRVIVSRAEELAPLAGPRGGETHVFHPAVRINANRTKEDVKNNTRCCTRLRKKEATEGASR
jgi:hypothetical protein